MGREHNKSRLPTAQRFGTSLALCPDEYQVKGTVGTMQLRSLDYFATICAGIGKKRMAVVMAENEHSLLAAMRAHQQGLIQAVLIGDEKKIRALMEEHQLSTEGVRFHQADEPEKAVTLATRLVLEGEVDYLMKGGLETRTMMKAFIARENGMRTGRLMSQVAFVENPFYHKLLALTDSALNPKPDLAQKKQILENAVEVFHSMGVECPKVAVLAAAETLNPKLQESTDAQALKEMYQRGEITGCIVEGPISIDLSIEPESAKIKGYDSPVAGDADLLICPDLVSGNMMGKMMLFMGARSANVVVGARAPVILCSRSATEEDKFQSIEEGTFSPERAGGLPSIGWARVCCSGDYTFEELSAMVRGKGGLTAYLGTNDVREVEAKVRAGDKKAALIYEAMIYQTAKCIGGLAAAADGEIDGVVLTGGIANSELLVEKLRRKVRFIAPVAVIPGEFEMEALAAGITRVLKGEEKARVYREHEEEGA